MRSVRPMIGVTTSEVRVAPRLPHTPQADPARVEMALGMSYAQAIAAAGARSPAVVLPPVDVDRIEPLLARLAGVCLSGGPDLHPAAYGAKPDARLGRGRISTPTPFDPRGPNITSNMGVRKRYLTRDRSTILVHDHLSGSTTGDLPSPWFFVPANCVRAP